MLSSYSIPSRLLRVIPLLFVAMLLLFSGTAQSQILEQTRTLSVDLDLLLHNTADLPELQNLIKRNRDKALWLIETADGQSVTVDYVDPADGQSVTVDYIDPVASATSTMRFNPRRCMRAVTDSLVAAKFGGVKLNGVSLTDAQIVSLRTRGANELRRASDQALAAPNPRWPWYDPFLPQAPEIGTLQVAEVTACLAVAYDWLRGSPLLTSTDRSRARQAILKGLHRLEDFAAVRFTPQQCQPSCKASQTCSIPCWSNWNAVVNGAAITAAVTLENDVQGSDQTFVQSVLARAPITLQTYFRLFSYDANDSSRNGAYPEGPTYLNYSLEYLALADSALATKYQLASGFDYTGTGVVGAGTFALNLISPNAPVLKGSTGSTSGLSINFSDGSSTVIPSIPALSWLGRSQNNPEYIAAAQLLARAPMNATVLESYTTYTMDALSVLWFMPSTTAYAPPDTSSRLFGDTSGHNNIAFLRRKVNNSLSLFAMLKGGMAAETPHGHMDVGNFIIEALGRRWAFDLSHESYVAPNYFVTASTVSPWRWDYLRANNHGHNVISIDGNLQDPNAVAPIAISTQGTDSQNTAVVNLRNVYLGQASAVRRLLAINNSGKFIVKDVIEGVPIGKTVTWQMIYCRAMNPGKNICYSDVDINPISLSPAPSTQAIIAEEVQSPSCPKPRYLSAALISPSGAQFSTSKLVAPDIIIPGTNGGPSTSYEQEDSAAKSKCYTLSVNVPVSSATTTVEIQMTPLQVP